MNRKTLLNTSILILIFTSVLCNFACGTRTPEQAVSEYYEPPLEKIVRGRVESFLSNNGFTVIQDFKSLEVYDARLELNLYRGRYEIDHQDVVIASGQLKNRPALYAPMYIDYYRIPEQPTYELPEAWKGGQMVSMVFEYFTHELKRYGVGLGLLAENWFFGLVTAAAFADLDVADLITEAVETRMRNQLPYAQVGSVIKNKVTYDVYAGILNGILILEIQINFPKEKIKIENGNVAVFKPEY